MYGDLDNDQLQTINEKQEQRRKLKELAVERAIILVLVQTSATHASHRSKIKRGWRRKESESAGRLRNLGYHHDLEGFVVVTVRLVTMIRL